MLISLELENWKTHKDSKIYFFSGVNLIIGSIGSGKSSILEAISYALFGTIPSLKRRELKINDLKNAFLKKEKLQVKLRIKIDNQLIEITRIIDNNKSDAELRINNKLVEKGSERVTEFVEKLIDCDYDTFQRAIFAEQNSIDNIFSMDNSLRKIQIDRILGIEKMEKARKNLTTYINYLSNNAKNLREQATNEVIKNEFNLLTEAKKELEGNELDLKNKFAEYNSFLIQFKEIEKNYKEIKLAYENKKKLEKEFVSLKAKKEFLENELKDLDSQSLEKEIVILENKIKELENNINTEKTKLNEIHKLFVETNKSIAVIKSKFEENNKKKDELNDLNNKIQKIKKLDDLQHELDEVEKNIIKFQNLKSIKENELENCIKNLDYLVSSKEKSVCPVCKTKLNEVQVEKLIKDYEELSKNLKQEIKFYSSEIERLNSNKLTLKKDIERIKEISIRINELNKVISDHDFEKDISNLEQKLINLKKEEELQNNKIKEFQAEKEQLQINLNDFRKRFNFFKELQKISEELVNVQSKILEIKINDHDFQNALENFQRSLVRKKEIEASLDVIKERIQQLSRRVKEREERYNELIKLKEKADKYEDLANKLNALKNALMESQEIIRSRIIAILNSRMNSIWRNLYPYNDIKEVNLIVDENSYKFVAKKDYLMDVSQLSGGEKSCFALAFRLALVSVLAPKLNVFFLDEPTHNLDSEAILTLGIVLEERLPELISQTIIITHEKELIRENFSNIIKIKRDKNSDSFSVVEQKESLI